MERIMKQIFSIIFFLSISMFVNAGVVELDSASYALGDQLVRYTMETQDSQQLDFKLDETNIADFIHGLEENLPFIKYTQDSIRILSFSLGAMQCVFFSDAFQSQIDVIPCDCILAGLMKVVNQEVTLPQDTISINEYMKSLPEDIDVLDLPEEERCKFYTGYGVMKGLQPGLQEYITEMTGKSRDEAPADYEAYAAGFAMVMKSVSMSGMEESYPGAYELGVGLSPSVIMTPYPFDFSEVDFLDGCRAGAGLVERKMTIEEADRICSTIIPDNEDPIVVTEENDDDYIPVVTEKKDSD